MYFDRKSIRRAAIAVLVAVFMLGGLVSTVWVFAVGSKL